jgi:hypothetical protein
VSLPAEGVEPENVSVRPVFDRLSPFIERPPLRGAWGSALTRTVDHFSRSLDLPPHEKRAAGGHPSCLRECCVYQSSCCGVGEPGASCLGAFSLHEPIPSSLETN